MWKIFALILALVSLPFTLGLNGGCATADQFDVEIVASSSGLLEDATVVIFDTRNGMAEVISWSEFVGRSSADSAP